MDIEKIKNFLKEIINMPNWYLGTIDKNQDKAIGIYTGTRQIGKISNFENLQTYHIVPFSLLIRYTQNFVYANNKAYEIYNSLKRREFEIDNVTYYINLLDENPQNTGSDDKGVYEFVIDFDMIVKGAKQNE